MKPNLTTKMLALALCLLLLNVTACKNPITGGGGGGGTQPVVNSEITVVLQKVIEALPIVQQFNQNFAATLNALSTMDNTTKQNLLMINDEVNRALVEVNRLATAYLQDGNATTFQNLINTLDVASSDLDTVLTSFNVADANTRSTITLVMSLVASGLHMIDSLLVPHETPQMLKARGNRHRPTLKGDMRSLTLQGIGKTGVPGTANGEGGHSTVDALEQQQQEQQKPVTNPGAAPTPAPVNKNPNAGVPPPKGAFLTPTMSCTDDGSTLLCDWMGLPKGQSVRMVWSPDKQLYQIHPNGRMAFASLF